MDRKRIFHILEWTVALAACVYLVYRLVVFDDYASLWASLRAMGENEWSALALCVVLMPLNMALEAWRWRTLVPMSWRDARLQVYYSKLAGLVTPWRLGEYPARGLMELQRDETQSTKDVMARVLTMGAVGSVTMTVAIVVTGTAALAFSPAVLAQTGYSYMYALIGVVLVLGVCVFFAPQWLRNWLTGDRQQGPYQELNSNLILRSIGQSFVRLLCWCVQLLLVLYALGGLGSPDLMENLSQTAVYYLFVTVSPNVPLVEAGVRGAWAMAVFGSVNAALAGVLLWAVNTLLPCLIGLFLRKNTE